MLGRITYWNSYRRYGFITVTVGDGNGSFQEQYFFHHSHFKNGDAPVLGALVVFNLGEPVALGKKIQAVQVRYATSKDVADTGSLAVMAGGIN